MNWAVRLRLRSATSERATKKTGEFARRSFENGRQFGEFLLGGPTEKELAELASVLETAASEFTGLLCRALASCGPEAEPYRPVHSPASAPADAKEQD